jgi:phosphopentomutase
MTFHFLIVTTSEDVHRHIGVKKLNIIPKDVRYNYPDLFSNCNVASIIVDPGKNAVDRVPARGVAGFHSHR